MYTFFSLHLDPFLSNPPFYPFDRSSKNRKPLFENERKEEENIFIFEISIAFYSGWNFIGCKSDKETGTRRVNAIAAGFRGFRVNELSELSESCIVFRAADREIIKCVWLNLIPPIELACFKR